MFFSCVIGDTIITKGFTIGYVCVHQGQIYYRYKKAKKNDYFRSMIDTQFNHVLSQKVVSIRYGIW